jgi:murein L,D-transpeptidase YafK
LGSDATSAGPSSRLPPLSTPQPEERLINIYRMIGKGDLGNALRAAEVLAQDQPRFTLAQLVYGDLLLAETGMLRGFGRGTAQVAGGANEQVSPLQHEARLRLQAWQNLPPPGSVPRQILQLPASVRQVVAVDGLRSRLFILEQRVGGLVMTSSHYASIGRLGMGKRNEGDLRTPLGLYDITGRLFTKQIGDFYGAGALSLSYPNPHDRRLQRSGANIWLHGTRLGRYADAPLSSNGCIVLANDDMGQLLNDLVPRRTPVIITDKLEWVSPKSLSAQRTWAQNLVDTWRMARMQGDLPKLMSLYAQDFDNGELRLADWRQRLSDELTNSAHRDRQLIDLSLLMWQDQEEVLFVSFREVLRGSSTGPLRQQYWARESGQWRIFSEGVVE